MGTTEVEYTDLRKRLDAAYQEYRKAQDEMIRAEAEISRRMIIEIADKHPGLEKIEFTTTFEYDDEGGYFETANTNGVVNETAPGEANALEEHGDPEDEILDLNIQPSVIRLLCGGDPLDDHEDEGSVTIAELREISF